MTSNRETLIRHCERPWTIYRCPGCGVLSGFHGRCRNAYSETCQVERTQKVAVEVVPVDCEWSAMVEHHMAERGRLEKAIRKAHGFLEDGRVDEARIKLSSAINLYGQHLRKATKGPDEHVR